MINKEKIYKETIDCPICGKKKLIKKYISMHIKRRHPQSEYSKIISQGMTFKNNTNKDISLKENNYYCKICEKIINKSSVYMHLKTLLHQKLSKNNINDNKNISKKENNSFNKDIKFIINKKEPLYEINDKNMNNNDNKEKAEETINDGINIFNKMDINTNNIIRLKVNYDNDFNPNKNSYSIISASLESKSNFSDNFKKDKIYYKPISTGLIPKNFIIGSCNDAFECAEESKIGSMVEESEFISNNFHSYSKNSFFSYSSGEEINNNSLSILTPEEFLIRSKIDGIIQNLIDKKNKKRKRKKCINN